MYIGKEAFIKAPDRQSAKALFAKSVSRVEVETHSYCNRRCDYCPNSTGDRLGTNRRLPEELWSLLLSNLQEVDFAGNFVFSGYNEPLADRLILERVREARSHVPRARLMIYTNGDYLSPAYLEELSAAGLDYLHISIHVLPGEKYDDLNSINSMVDVARRLEKPIRFIKMSLQEYLIATVPSQVTEIEIRSINYWNQGTDRGGLLSGFTMPARRSLPCHFPFAHVNVGYDGTVVPCCHIKSDAEMHGPYRYGNLRDYGSIFELYGAEAAVAWRRHLISPDDKQGPCSNCSVSFLNNDQGAMNLARMAWEKHVKEHVGR